MIHTLRYPRPVTEHRGTAIARERSTVFGIESPWSGDDNDPRPWTYYVWVHCYWITRRLRHRLGLHDWHTSMAGQRCTWCGKSQGPS